MCGRWDWQCCGRRQCSTHLLLLLLLQLLLRVGARQVFQPLTLVLVECLLHGRCGQCSGCVR